MVDSYDSDYKVEDYVLPDTVRHTSNSKDLISNDEEESSSSETEMEGINRPRQNVSTTDRQLNNGNGTNEDSDLQGIEENPPRANNRYILYVTNLATETSKMILEDFFKDAGDVRSIRIPKVRLGCYAFVEMADFSGFKVSSITTLKINLNS